jgi:hypothetical protein
MLTVAFLSLFVVVSAVSERVASRWWWNAPTRSPRSENASIPGRDVLCKLTGH